MAHFVIQFPDIVPVHNGAYIRKRESQLRLGLRFALAVSPLVIVYMFLQKPAFFQLLK